MNSKDLLIRVLRGDADEREREELRQLLDIADSQKNSIDVTQLASIAEIKVLAFKNQEARTRRRWTTIVAIAMCLASVLALTRPFSSPSKTFIFHDASIKQIITHVELNFDVTIKASPEVLACRFTGEFYRIESAQQIISIVAASNGFVFLEHQLGQLEIRGIRCR